MDQFVQASRVFPEVPSRLARYFDHPSLQSVKKPKVNKQHVSQVSLITLKQMCYFRFRNVSTPYILAFNSDLIRSAAHCLLSSLVTLKICNDRYDGKHLLFPNVFPAEFELILNHSDRIEVLITRQLEVFRL